MSPRKGWVAVALSVAVPGLGHVYAGWFGVAVALLAVDRLTPPLLDLLAGAGLFSVKTLAFTRLLLPLCTRLFAAVLALGVAKSEEPAAPFGAYAFYAVAWVLAAVVLGRLAGAFVTLVPLGEGGHGLKGGDRVLVTRLGAASEPRPGALAVWFSDATDAGPARPLVPTPRRVRVGRVTDAGPDDFEIDGWGAVPLAEYGGRPLGVLSAPSPSGQGLDFSRVGVVPTP